MNPANRLDRSPIPRQTHSMQAGMRMLWLEITGKCQLQCTHCYAASGPTGNHGVMTVDAWKSVITQAADARVSVIQFIGGEPTLHPDLGELIRYALDAGLAAEVYSNLVHVPARLWDTFTLPGVSLATSYYTTDPLQHTAIAQRPTLERTRANIMQALARSIPLRVGVVDLGLGDIDQITADLRALGIEDIGVDRVRQLGRASTGCSDVSELCGQCGRGVAAVLPDGTVTPCPMARWLAAGTFRQLGDVLTGMSAYADAAGIPPITAQPCKPDGNGQCEPKCRPGCDPGVQCVPKGGR